jgi:23S rRNA (uracil1939-C5)-methyltransferase
MQERLYAEWKRNIVVEAFRQRAMQPDIAPLLAVPSHSRRRAILTAKRDAGGGLSLGYHARRSHHVTGIEECPVLDPRIVARLRTLASIAAVIAEPELRLTVLSTPAGLDVCIESGRACKISGQSAARLARIAVENGIVRLTVAGQTVLSQASPVLQLGGVPVVAPPGAFVQAVAAAEQAMVSHVLAGVGGARRIADLFAGIGTFTFALARRASVLALDGDGPMLEALASAARKAPGLKPIEIRVRDLFREPLSAKELEGFDAVVFDPPRAGAKAQAAQLARSGVSKIAAVSCDPGTLARDVRMLVDGGYALDRVIPIDQFLFSAQVEAIALLRRD